MAENFSFCTEKVDVTVIVQPSIMYKVLVGGYISDFRNTATVEVHPRDEWLKFFEMLLREFQDDQCYDISFYDPLKQEAMNFREFKDLFPKVIDQYYVDFITIDMDNSGSIFVLHRSGLANSFKAPVYPAGSHAFLEEEMNKSNDGTRNVVLYIASHLIDDKTEDALFKLQNEKQYAIILLSMVMYTPNFTWLSTQRRNLWYHLGRQMDQFGDIRNLLRNPDYKGSELKITGNSINTTCLAKDHLNITFIITEGIDLSGTRCRNFLPTRKL